MKKYLIIILSVCLIIFAAAFIFSRYPIDVNIGNTSKQATYIDYSDGYDFILDETHYYEKEFNDGWYADTPKGEQVLIFGEGVKFNHTAYFLAENNDKTLGIKILGTSDKGIYAFPGDIIYPNPKTEYPNRISIFYSPSAEEDFIQLDLQQDHELITKISGAVYDNTVYEMLPESILENSDITEISIRLFWDNYPYYFEQILTKNTDNQFKITNQETVS